MKARRAAEAATDTAPGATLAEDARLRLLHAGLRLFALQGFAKTSTRELAEAASVNVAAISYYFGDKAGLYRAVFFEPMAEPVDEVARFTAAGLSLEAALRGFFARFVEPLRRGDQARLCMKLQFREMLEPTGLWEETVAHGIQPLHDALVLLLARHLGLNASQRELQRLAVCLAGMGVHLHVGHDITNQVAPGLNDGPQALDDWADALTRYALVLVQAEAARLGAALQGEPKS